MSSAKKDRPRKPQVNLRLSPSEREILDALAYLEEKSASEVVRPLVVDYLRRRGQEEGVKIVMAERTRERARRAGRVAEIGQRKSGQSKRT